MRMRMALSMNLGMYLRMNTSEEWQSALSSIDIRSRSGALDECRCQVVTDRLELIFLTNKQIKHFLRA
jgi:hypothetical protein